MIEMLEAELLEIEARATAATPGPWWPVHMGGDEGEACVMAEHLSITDGCKGGEVSRDDAAFIAAARTDVPRLVAEARRLREERDALAKGIAEAGERLCILREQPLTGPQVLLVLSDIERMAALFQGGTERAQKHQSNLDHWSFTIPQAPWMDDPEDRTNFLLLEIDRLSGKLDL